MSRSTPSLKSKISDKLGGSYGIPGFTDVELHSFVSNQCSQCRADDLQKEGFTPAGESLSC